MSLFWIFRRSSATDFRSMTDYAAEAADSAQANAHMAEADIRQTDERLEQLLLVCSAMWELLRERTNLSEADLITRVAEIHTRDSEIPKEPRRCPACGRVIVQHHQKCIYCGAVVPADNAFKTV